MYICIRIPNEISGFYRKQNERFFCIEKTVRFFIFIIKLNFSFPTTMRLESNNSSIPIFAQKKTFLFFGNIPFSIGSMGMMYLFFPQYKGDTHTF